MKIKALILSVVICVGTFGISSCGNPNITGNNLIMQAREEYVGLDCAKVVITNVDTEKTEEIFTFKYVDDTLTYSDWEVVDGKQKYEYNDGKINAFNDGEKYYEYKSGDKDFKKYTRSNKHEYVKDDMITYMPSAIIQAKMENVGDKREITHIYDVEKINPPVPEGKATGFSVKYVFDKDQNLENFVETFIYDVNGTEKREGYKTVIQDKNNIKEIQNKAKSKK